MPLDKTSLSPEAKLRGILLCVPARGISRCQRGRVTLLFAKGEEKKGAAGRSPA